MYMLKTFEVCNFFLATRRKREGGDALRKINKGLDVE
jgi:hypothetical protein